MGPTSEGQVREEDGMAAGYSSRRAAQKLGVKAGSRLGVIDADEGWTLEGLPEGVEVRNNLRGRRDVTVAFIRSRRDIESNAHRFEGALEDAATL